jgi:hypothetical protein
MHPGLEPDTLLTLLEDDLTPWVKELKGLLSVAADPWNFLELLAESPVGWRGVLHWDGDENRMDHPDSGCYVRNRFSFGVTCQQGLTAKPLQSLHKARPGGAPALLRLVALARLRIRSFAFPADVSERFVRYAGTEPVILPDGVPLAGYRLRFELTAHPEPVPAYRNL